MAISIYMSSAAAVFATMRFTMRQELIDSEAAGIDVRQIHALPG
jgi:hypothetical protein